MSLLNLAQGNAMFAQPPYYASGVGVNTPWGLLMPPGSRIAAMVRSTGAQDLDEPPLADQLVNNLSDALARCRSGMGDFVLVHPNHTENVSATGGLTNLVPGTNIVGLQDPATGLGPKFTWTADVTWAIDDANVTLSGLNLQFNGANNIAAGITVSAANCRILGCNINMGTGASNDAVLGVTVSAAGDGMVFAGNKARQSGGTSTSVITFAACDDPLVCDNDLQTIGAAVGSGVIATTAATTNLRFLRNIVAQYNAASTAGIVTSDHASTGVIAHNLVAILADGVAASTGISLGASSLVRCFENYNCDEPIKSGVLSPAACAT